MSDSNMSRQTFYLFPFVLTHALKPLQPAGYEDTVAGSYLLFYFLLSPSFLVSLLFPYTAFDVTADEVLQVKSEFPPL